MKSGVCVQCLELRVYSTEPDAERSCVLLRLMGSKEGQKKEEKC